MKSKQILITVNPDFEPEDGTHFDAVVSALEHFDIPANLVEVKDVSSSNGDALRNALSLCSEQMEQCRKMFRDDKDFIAALESAEAALSNDNEPKQIEIFQGYFGLEGATLNVEFQSFVGASVPEKDAAFMAALAQQADVDYHSVGVAGYAQENDSLLDVSEAIVSITMQNIVGDYDTPDQIPEWSWVERVASYAHAKNGQDGIWEFVLNMSFGWDDIPDRLLPVISEAKADNIAYLIFHQGT